MHLLILHLATTFGGAERTTSNLLTHLERTGIRRITLAAPAALGPLMPPRFDDFVDTSGSIRHGWYDTPAGLFADAGATAKILAATQPDLALGIMHYSASLLALGARRLRRRPKTIGSYRGPAFEHMRRYERGWRRRAWLRAVIGGTAWLADRMIVPSTGTKRELQRRFLGPGHRIQVIPNGIDAAATQQLAKEPADGLDTLPTDLPRLCVAARLSVEKDLALLLEAFRRLQSRRPTSLIIVGDGPERERLQAVLHAWGLVQRVVFVGHRANVFPYIAAADIYVHSCQFEGFGYTMLEAMACGTPVVATDCPYGPAEVLDRGRYGRLTPPGDAAALANAIGDLLDDPAAVAALRLAGLERAGQLSVTRMVDAYARAFEQLVRAPNASH